MKQSLALAVLTFTALATPCLSINMDDLALLQVSLKPERQASIEVHISENVVKSKEACIDLSGVYGRSAGGKVFLVQTGCSGTSGSWSYTVTGSTANIGNSITGAVTGTSGSYIITWSNGVTYTQEACMDLSGLYGRSAGGQVSLVQTGCSGTSGSWSYTVTGSTPKIGNSITGAVTGASGSYIISWSNGVTYTMVQTTTTTETTTAPTYASVGWGQCTDANGVFVTSTDPNSIGWSPCTPTCTSVGECKEECTAIPKCVAFGKYQGDCWLYAKMTTPYVTTNGVYPEYQCFSSGS